ncbi:hypothetical protein OSCI_2970001 [Kamptonema sp. PCC 6506]|nr:hypothetical protein OSCI_2970001 [Kamptonema sp. PCC 6506]
MLDGWGCISKGVSASRLLNQDAEDFWESMSANTTLKPHFTATTAQWTARVVFPDPPFLDKRLTTNISNLC